MKKFLVAFLICFSMVTTSMDADAAKRFGGGSSFGRPAPTFSQKAPAPSAAPKAPQQQNAAGQQRQQPNAAPAQQAQRPSMMRSVLTGLAAALGISALLSLLGIEGAGLVSLITGILAAVAIFFVLSPKTCVLRFFLFPEMQICFSVSFIFLMIRLGMRSTRTFMRIQSG